MVLRVVGQLGIIQARVADAGIIGPLYIRLAGNRRIHIRIIIAGIDVSGLFVGFIILTVFVGHVLFCILFHNGRFVAARKYGAIETIPGGSNGERSCVPTPCSGQ